MSDSKLKPHGNIVVKVREYEDKDGNMKAVWQRIGTLFASPHFSNIRIKIDSVPLNWDGFAGVYPIDKDKEAQDGPQEEPEDKGVVL